MRLRFLEALLPLAAWAEARGPFIANAVGAPLLLLTAMLFPINTARHLFGRKR